MKLLKLRKQFKENARPTDDDELNGFKSLVNQFSVPLRV